ncbi:hypothetical protein [Microbacterium hominis]|uniref:Integral membrane protein n=1 Tax=Microbacterium hominis TaxID=162426 RepID=A0A7D4Q1Z5_9MICO|nr:hypothetical protein [Microbacterium hominis]QKJ20198.1 hypothetical protein HQM25_13055 [Microbacterium hominis]
MRRGWPFIVPGVLLALVGAIWTLQGLNVLQGSVMSGSSMWATIGPFVLIAGVALIWFGVARSRSQKR